MDVTFWANVSQIVTGVIAIFSVAWYLGWTVVHRNQLVRYLRDEKKADVAIGKQGKRTPRHLMAKLGMSENQLYTAYFFAQCRIGCYLTEDEDGYADKILFGYKV